MIFDKDYDDSLWYILRADLGNRKELSRFIKDIPESLLENIRLSIEQAKKGEFNYDEQPLDFYKHVSKNDPTVYFDFQLDNDDCLTITKTRFNGETEDDEFELMIFPLSMKDVKEMENYDEEWIGTVTNKISTTHLDDTFSLISCNESEYNLIKTPLGYFVNYSKELSEDKEIGLYKPVLLRRVPKDLNRGKI